MALQNSYVRVESLPAYFNLKFAKKVDELMKNASTFLVVRVYFFFGHYKHEVLHEASFYSVGTRSAT